MPGVISPHFHATRTTSLASRGIIDDAGPVHTELIGGLGCEGYGAPEGTGGGYGVEESGYGSPCSILPLWVESVMYEGFPISEFSALPRVTRKWANENGGQLVTLRCAIPMPPGNYKVELRFFGSARLVECYGGVYDQGNIVYVNEDGTSISFVCPKTTAVGAADIVVTLPSGAIITLLDALEIVPYSIRSSRTTLERLCPNHLLVELGGPTVLP